ncbi:MAG: protein kinase domain-containing protein [Nodosilinea sp.]
MSLCINPRCPQPNHADNGTQAHCAACGSSLLLQGRYRVMRLISQQTGFGQIYEAYDQNVPKILKVLKQSYNHNPKVVGLFQREAQVLSHLNHPGVPQVESRGYFHYFPQGSSEPCHCLVMEKIDGPNLKQWMVQQGNHPISEKQAILWLTQLTDVLHLIHRQNYFHRDIKPDNIMLRSSGQLVLVDFGAAREMTQTYLAQLGDSGITTVSSAGYTPPEQEQGQAVPQSDFYAMGRTLIYLLTARAPNDPAIYDSRTNQFNWRPYAPQISPALADLIDQLTATAAANRPQTTQAILQALAQVRLAPDQATPTQSATPIPSPVLPDWPVTSLNSQESNSRRPPVWAIAGLASLALALPLGWYSLSRRGTPPVCSLPSNASPLTVTAAGVLAGHRGEIKDLKLWRKGQMLITASEDQTIRFWDLATKKQIRSLHQHTNAVKALALTTDQNILISAGDDRTIRLWSLPEGKTLGVIANAHEVPINALEVSHNNKFLASADSNGTIKLWPLPLGQRQVALLTLKAEGTVNDLLFSRDSGLLVSGGKGLRFWDLTRLEQPTPPPDLTPISLKTSGALINYLEISDDDQTLMTASVDKTVALWDRASRSEKMTLQGSQGIVNSLEVESGQVWSAGLLPTMVRWRLADLQPQSCPGADQIKGFTTDIWRFALLPERGQVVTIGGHQFQIRLWQMPRPTP